MIEISAWILVLLIQLLFVGSVATGHIVFQQRAQVHRYRQEIAALEAKVAKFEAPPPPPPPPEQASSSAAPSPRLIFLSEQDVAAATRPAEDSNKDMEDGEQTLDALCVQLLKCNQEMTNVLDTVLERSADLGVKLGALKGAESVSDGLKNGIQGAIDQVRQSDDALVTASDKGLELEESLRFLQTKVVDSQASVSMIDHMSLNEILTARVDGRSEDEMARLREEVRQRLRAVVHEDDPAVEMKSAT